MTAYDAYVICTAPRSGSTLLCRMLQATGVAGRPRSYFHDPSLNDWAEYLSHTADEKGGPAYIRSLIGAAVEVGRAGGRVFGLRLQAHSAPYFSERLAEAYPGGGGDAERMTTAFGRTFFIHLARPDKVAQAVSFEKARRSGLWHVAPSGAAVERLTPEGPMAYDEEALLTRHDEMAAHDAMWADWFAREGAKPLRMNYDELSADPRAATARVLSALGLDPAAAEAVEPPVAKLSDAVNEDWTRRLRAALRARPIDAQLKAR